MLRERSRSFKVFFNLTSHFKTFIVFSLILHKVIINCFEGTIKSNIMKVTNNNEIIATGLACPIKNNNLYDEIRCGLDKNSTENFLLIYSGSYDLKISPFFSVFCIDIIIKNIFVDLDLKSLWHGKCFASKYTDANEYMDINNKFFQNENATEFSLTQNNTLLYSMRLPSLIDSSYLKINVSDKKSFTTHTHYFQNFFGKKSDQFCSLYNSKSIMNLQTDKLMLYLNKIKSSDNIYLKDNFFTLFGLKNNYTKQDLDMNNCFSFVFFSTGNYTHNMIYNVKEDVTVPLVPPVNSILTNSSFRDIFSNINTETATNAGLSKESINHSFDLNNAFIEYINKEMSANENVLLASSSMINNIFQTIFLILIPCLFLCF